MFGPRRRLPAVVVPLGDIAPSLEDGPELEAEKEVQFLIAGEIISQKIKQQLVHQRIQKDLDQQINDVRYGYLLCLCSPA